MRAPETAALRYLGVSVIAVLARRSVLLLETTGRRTGSTRRSALAYWRDDQGAIFVAGGAGGLRRVDWIANVRSQPQVAVRIRRRRFEVTARELVGEEYEDARRVAFARWPDVARYERSSGRRIPIFRLDLPR